jgi:predicted phage terminase large subunit-like protein
VPNDPPRPNTLFGRFAQAARSDWHTIARPEQLAPTGDWTSWVFCGGRGAGKTRSGAEWVQGRVEAGRARRIHLISPTASDCRDVLVEGESGILSVAPSHARPIYSPSLRKLEWPNGAMALLFSGEEFERLRGPQCDTLWVDELCAMRQAQAVIDMAMLGLRLGKDPRCLITTTPRPIKPFKQLLAREGQDVVVTRSSTFANAENLARQFLQQIVTKYQGTRLGKQELYAELLTDTPGALWTLQAIEESRVPAAPELIERVVVAVDPAVSFGPDADETGILVVARAADGQAYVLDDLSGRYPPVEWATRAINAYRDYRADRIVAEINQGGAMVENTLRSVDAGIPYKAVHAARGKQARAEPVSALYEQGRVHHVGIFGPLEDQMTGYDGTRTGTGSSPDRLDALVWGLTELMLGEPTGGYFKLASLLVDGEPAPPPLRPDRIYVTLMTSDRSDSAAGAIYWARSKHYGTPLTLLAYDLVEIEAALADDYLPAVQARAQELCEQTQSRQRTPFGIWVADDALGSTFRRQGLHARIDVRVVPGKLLPASLADRTQAVRGYVSQGRLIKLAQHAHERVQVHRGVAANHLLRQLLAYEPDAAGAPCELVNAFCAGIALAFDDPRGRVVSPSMLNPAATPEVIAEEPLSAQQQAFRDADADARRQILESQQEFGRRATAEVAAGRPYPRTYSAVGMTAPPCRTATTKISPTD